ncbi:PROTEIN ROLLING PROTEIN [Salix viminalis]|uniref:PROTEIN ROLLING PROTEIN n=1 Tax=Salix viminalis TaxID=40686 RepID=A0A9Q0UGA8_SALVM|nr:PROTEIN ROLLING PROTEIN [Salix viminalis]
MALVIYWYDFVCFGIVAASLAVSFWVLWRRELASKCDDNIIYQSLLVARPDITDRTVVAAMPGNHVGSSQLWTSCWKQVHPGWLLATRSISFLVMAGLLWRDIVEWDATIFIYYTEWTFMLIMIYFALGTVMSAYGCWVSFKQPAVSEHGEKSVFLKRDVEEDGTATSITYKEKKSEGTVKLGTHCAEEAIRERAGFWGYLMQIIYQTCAGAVILTDIIFWCVIVPFLSNSHLGLNALMGCMHSLNAVFLLIDTALNSLPFPWFRLAYFVQWSCLYVIFQWVIHACGFTWWPYPFLELNTPWAPLWYFAMAAIHIPCYGIYALISVFSQPTAVKGLYLSSFLLGRNSLLAAGISIWRSKCENEERSACKETWRAILQSHRDYQANFHEHKLNLNMDNDL